MRMLPPSVRRPALAVILCFAALAGASSKNVSAAAIDQALPDSTLVYAEVKNVSELRDAFHQTQFGKLLADPAMKPLLNDLKDKLEEPNAEVKKALGMDLHQLLSIPQGGISLAVVGLDRGEPPIGMLLTADAGKNAEQMADVMNKLTAMASEKDAKVSTEEYQGSTLHLIRDKNDDEDKPALVWTSKGSVYHIGVGMDVIKGVLSKESRDDSLANNDVYKKARKQAGDSQIFMFVDTNAAIKFAIDNIPNDNIQQVEGILQLLGVNGLKSISASMGFNTDGYDSLTKIIFSAPKPAQGILRMFEMPRVAMKPEPWIPESVTDYQSNSWDLDEFFEAINDLVNQVAPGALNIAEQQIAGAGEPISFQKDIFGPLGNRITVASVTDPEGKLETPPTLFAIALQDAKAFESTLNKLFKLANAKPQEREFQGVMIRDIDMPEIPGAAGNPGLPESISLAIAKDTLFVATDAKLLEQSIRGGGRSLADSPEYKRFARELPETVSALTFSKPENAARSFYNQLKNGTLDQSLEPARATGAKIPRISEIIDMDKIPSFDVFKKYLTQSGGYWIQDDEGTTMTSFALKPQAP